MTNRPVSVAPGSAVPDVERGMRLGRFAAAWLRRPDVVAPIAVAVVSALVFGGSVRNGFVEWDDHALFVDNQGYRGLGWAQLRWMLTSVLMGHYVPVTWLTHGVDYVLWGMNPAGYHLTNVLIHAVNAALVYLIACRLLSAATSFVAPTVRISAAVAALFFSLHPLRVESVTWITERRDVLSGLFFFATVLLYLRAASVPRGSRPWWTFHAAACAAFLLGTLSKSIVMTLPVVLVLVDLYPLRRLPGDPRTWLSAPAVAVWREKVPYVALGMIAAMLGYYAQAINGFFTKADVIPWTVRPSLALYSLWFYLSKTIMPLRLGPLYELPATIHPLAARFVAPAAIAILFTAVLILVRRRWPAGLAVWASYIVTVAPVAGLTHSGFQLAHDRYSYLSCVGWALLVGAGAGAVAEASRRNALRPQFARLAAVAVFAWLGGLAVLTTQQVDAWHDTDTLWLNAAEAQPDCSLCRYNVGARAFNSGLHAVAREEFMKLLRERPDKYQVHAQLGLAQVGVGDVEKAIPHYHRVLARNPDDSETHNNLGAALRLLGRHREALHEFQWALTLAPDNAVVRSNIAVVYFELGQTREALRHLQRAIELKPDLPQPRFALGVVMLAMGRKDAARAQYDLLRTMDPGFAKILGPGLLDSW